MTSEHQRSLAVAAGCPEIFHCAEIKRFTLKSDVAQTPGENLLAAGIRRGYRLTGYEFAGQR